MAKTAIAEIIVNEDEQREVDGIAELAESIDEVGLLQPIAISPDNHLIYGYHRYLACKSLGWTEIEADTLTADDQHRELARLDENLIRNEGWALERAEWLKRRKQIYESLHPETKRGGDHTTEEGKQTAESATCFVDDTAKKTGKPSRTVRAAIQIADSIPATLRDKIKAAKDCNLRKRQTDLLKIAKMKDDPKRQKAVVKAVLSGDAKTAALADRTYQEQLDAKQYTGDGKATVWVADCIDWLKQQDPCDLLLTDPPYATDVDDVTVFAASWLPIALSKVKPTGRAYVCVGPYPDELLAYMNADRADMTLAQVLVWTYRNTIGPSPKDDYKNNWQAILYFRGVDAPPLDCKVQTEQFSVFDINAPDGRIGNRYHAWQKPDELAERLIRHASKPGDTILDPFAGTGTFLMVARKLGRIGLGCEVDPAMTELVKKRGVDVAA